MNKERELILENQIEIMIGIRELMKSDSIFASNLSRQIGLTNMSLNPKESNNIQKIKDSLESSYEEASKHE